MPRSVGSMARMQEHRTASRREAPKPEMHPGRWPSFGPLSAWARLARARAIGAHGADAAERLAGNPAIANAFPAPLPFAVIGPLKRFCNASIVMP